MSISLRTYAKCGEKSCTIIIDSNRCTNVVSPRAVSRIGLPPVPHPHPYHITQATTSTLPVTQRCLVPIRFGWYPDFVWCDVVPLTEGHVILGQPWLRDRGVTIYSESNSCSLIYEGKRIRFIHVPKPVCSPTHPSIPFPALESCPEPIAAIPFAAPVILPVIEISREPHVGPHTKSDPVADLMDPATDPVDPYPLPVVDPVDPDPLPVADPVGPDPLPVADPVDPDPDPDPFSVADPTDPYPASDPDMQLAPNLVPDLRDPDMLPDLVVPIPEPTARHITFISPESKSPQRRSYDGDITSTFPAHVYRHDPMLSQAIRFPWTQDLAPD